MRKLCNCSLAQDRKVDQSLLRRMLVSEEELLCHSAQWDQVDLKNQPEAIILLAHTEAD